MAERLEIKGGGTLFVGQEGPRAWLLAERRGIAPQVLELPFPASSASAFDWQGRQVPLKTVGGNRVELALSYLPQYIVFRKQ